MQQHYAIMQHLTHFPTIICTFFINCHGPTTNTTFAKIYSGCKYTPAADRVVCPCPSFVSCLMNLDLAAHWW